MKFALLVRNIKTKKSVKQMTEVEFKLIQAIMKEQTK